MEIQTGLTICTQTRGNLDAPYLARFFARAIRSPVFKILLLVVVMVVVMVVFVMVALLSCPGTVTAIFKRA